MKTNNHPVTDDPFEKIAYNTHRQMKIIDGEAATAIHQMRQYALGWDYESREDAHGYRLYT